MHIIIVSFFYIINEKIYTFYDHHTLQQENKYNTAFIFLAHKTNIN